MRSSWVMALTVAALRAMTDKEVIRNHDNSWYRSVKLGQTAMPLLRASNGAYPNEGE